MGYSDRSCGDFDRAAALNDLNQCLQQRNRLSEEPVEWRRSKIMDKEAIMNPKGKNWYVCIDGCVITVNAGSYTIITAHREK